MSSIFIGNNEHDPPLADMYSGGVKLVKNSWLKIKRAEKHIQDLHGFLDSFPSEPDFHSVSIDKVNPRWGINDLVITVKKSGDDFVDGAALIIGDALHNLRSALDILYFEIVRKGTATKWTRFPVRDTRQELISALNNALEQEQITQIVHDFILNEIKPYKAGNPIIWAMDDMNIMDKHKLLIPTFQIMGFSGIRLKNDKKEIIDLGTVLADKSCRVRLDDGVVGWDSAYGLNATVEDKGRAAIGIGFKLGTLYEGQPVLPALHAIAEEVTRTIKKFEQL